MSQNMVSAGVYSHLCKNTGTTDVSIAFFVTGTSGGWAVLSCILDNAELCNSPPPRQGTIGL